MTESEQSVLLSPDDVAVLRSQKVGLGCMFLIAAALIVGGILLTLRFPVPIVTIIYAIAALAFFVLLLIGKRVNNSEIEKDISGGKKTIIIAKIEDKRIESSEVKRGPRQGEINSKYFMKVKGREYPMGESAYLTIKEGEFVEIQEGPVSKKIISQKWLKSDGTSEPLPDK